MAFKRKRVYAPTRAGRSKRRRVSRRRRTTRGTASYSTRSLTASNPFRITAKKLSRKKWRSTLWNASLLKMHYKSIFAAANTLTTPTGTTTETVIVANALSESAGSQFWKTAGGAMDPGFGVRPTWMNAPGAGVPEPSTIIIRGGRLFCDIATLSTTDTVKVRVQLVFVKSQMRNITDTAASNTLFDFLTNAVSTARPISWTVQDMPDYSQYLFPPVLDKQMDMKPGDSAMLTYKVKTQKVDADEFNHGSGWFPLWFFYGSQTIDTTVGTNAIACNVGHNLSFAMMDTLDS